MSQELPPLIQQFNKVLSGLQQGVHRMESRIEDSLALEQLPKFNKNVYLPWTRSALCPSTLQIVLNEILIHKRKYIVECGSGISTLYINKILQQHEATFVSIDQDAEWQRIVQEQAKSVGEDLSNTQFVHAPLTSCPISPTQSGWYDMNLLNKSLPKGTIDLLLVDAPAASRPGFKDSRFPALPFFREKMSDDFVVFLDDCNRNGEQKIAKAWADEYELDALFLPEKGNICLFFPKEAKRLNVI